MDLTVRFEHAQTWAGDLSTNPYWRQKTRLIEALIPEGVETILDIGCGNGALTNRLAGKYRVFGFDGSKTALAHVETPAGVTRVEQLPLRDNCADLALCSEVLEHLPTEALDLAVKELKRVANRWLLVTVPLQERLALRHMWCDRCRRPFHVYGHVQTFTLARLGQLFAGCTLAAWGTCGELYWEELPPWLLALQQYFGRHWYYDSATYTVCPRCGGTEFRAHEGNRIAYWCDRIGKTLRTADGGMHPYWILTLWQKPCSSDRTPL